MKNLPHLTFLRSFEAAARHLSFTSAAVELNCTQSAVSNHVRSLEDFIGRPLFVRHPRSLSLTDVGEAYLPAVRHALQEIDAATRLLVAETHKREVVISCPVSLAEKWLAGVIGGFSRAHPGIGLTLHSTLWTGADSEVSDVAITISHQNDVDGSAVKLWEEKLALACAPDFLAEGAPLGEPAQLLQARLIHILGRTDYWEKVADHFGLEGLNLQGGMRCNSTSVALELAAGGLGCVVAPKSLVQPFQREGRLVEPFAFDLACPWAYFASFRQKPVSPSVAQFKAWLLAAAAEVQL